MNPKVTLSLSNLKADTPKSIKTIYRTIMYLSSVFSLASVAGLIPLGEHALFLINGWVAFSNAAIYQFCQMFGYASETQ